MAQRALRACAAFMDPVDPASAVRRLVRQHHWVDTSAQVNPSLRAILDRHHDARRVVLRFLVLNTYLMDAWVFAEKPAAHDRAAATGEYLAANYDVAALSEVFEKNIRDRILKAWPASSRPITSSAIAETSQRSSGLVTLARRAAGSPGREVDLRFSDRQFHQFSVDEGTDALASKGVLRSELDVGFGSSKLEIYSTHTNASGHHARRHQLREIAHFIERTHRRENPALVVGDFNVKPSDKATFRTPDTEVWGNIVPGRVFTEYSYLQHRLNELGFYDTWVARNGTPGYTSEMHRRDIARAICEPDATDDRYCDDAEVPATPPDPKCDRIDYLFSNRAEREHGFTVTYTRPRRTRMCRPRTAPEREDIPFLSDHVGLSTTLVLSPA